MTNVADNESLIYSRQRNPGQGEISPGERLLNAFEAHERQEREFAQKYKEIAERTKNPSIRFLLRMIVSDEEKHHAVTRAMALTLKGDLTWTSPGEAIGGISDVDKERGELLPVTEDFIRVEKEGIKEYEKLSKSCKGYYSGLFALLLRTMIRDSEKHLEILEFLRKTLKAA